jgi:hypothetical protein
MDAGTTDSIIAKNAAGRPRTAGMWPRIDVLCSLSGIIIAEESAAAY